MPTQATAEEVEVLKLARLFGELMRTEGWKAYCDLLEEQIKARLDGVLQPLHTVGFDGVGDLAGKAAAMESLKGAINGLRLAKELPSMTMAHADEIRQSLAAGQQEPKAS